MAMTPTSPVLDPFPHPIWPVAFVDGTKLACSGEQRAWENLSGPSRSAIAVYDTGASLARRGVDLPLAEMTATT